MFSTFVHKYLHLPYRLYVHVDQKAKRPRATILLLHGIGNSAAAWDEVVKELPSDVRVISIDLLGFGRSPSPRWMKYDIAIQARSVFATLLAMSIRQPLVVVGHSMGSLVAVELAKRYPPIVKSLVLCSPPFYDSTERRQLLPDPNKALRDFYQLILKNPSTVVAAAPLAMKLKLVGKAFDVTPDNIDIYTAVLESSIIHQTSLHDVKRLRKPIRLLHGAFDPVVIKKNLDQIVATNKDAHLTVAPVGHELLGRYVPVLVKTIEAIT